MESVEREKGGADPGFLRSLGLGVTNHLLDQVLCKLSTLVDVKTCHGGGVHNQFLTFSAMSISTPMMPSKK